MSKEVTLKKFKFLLGASEDSMTYLSDLNKNDLDDLFLQTANAINGGQTDLWERLAKGSNMMPAFIAAKLSENVFGEVVCANVASYMKVKDALRVINHLSIEFMAKTTPHMIPEKTKELINAIPIRKNRKVTQILLREKDYYTLARFVDTLEMSKVLEIANKDIQDELELLQISSFVENKSVVAEIFMNFSDDRKAALLQSAYSNGFREELKKTIGLLSADAIGDIRTILTKLPEDISHLVKEDLAAV